MNDEKHAQQQQGVDVDKNPPETPGESPYDKETRESQEKLAKLTKKKKAKK